MEELRKKLAETPLVDIADAQQEDVMSLEHSQTVADALKVKMQHFCLGADLCCPCQQFYSETSRCNVGQGQPIEVGHTADTNTTNSS